MARQFIINPQKFDELVKKYQECGLSDEDAASAASKVFDYRLCADERAIYKDGWEIDWQLHQKPLAINKIKVDNRIYLNWLKSGWNNSGVWAIDKSYKPQYKKLPLLSRISNAEGLSYEYYRYHNKCGRSIDREKLNRQDLLRALPYNDAKDEVRYEGVPFSFTANQFENFFLVTARGLKDYRNDGEAENSGRNFVFVIDVTSSMMVRWVLVKLTMTYCYSLLSEKDTVSILAFSSTIQMAAEKIHGKDMKSFQKAIDSVIAIGGNDRNLPILQGAYALLNEEDEHGCVVLFTDEMPDSSFRSFDACKEYIEKQSECGNDLLLMLYGTDSWCDDKAAMAVDAAKGRMQLILSPEDIDRISFEHLLAGGSHIYEYQVSARSSASDIFSFESVIGDSITQGFTLTEGLTIRSLFLAGYSQKEKLENILITLRWRADEFIISSLELSVPVKGYDDTEGDRLYEIIRT